MELYEFRNDTRFLFIMSRNLTDYAIIPSLASRMLRNFTDYATMLSFDFRHVTELHGLHSNGCQVPRSGQTRIASQQADGPQMKLGYDNNSSKEYYKESYSCKEEAENFNLMGKKFGKFLKKFKDIKFSKSSKKIESKNTFTCFKCGKQGHIKFECPIYLRKHIGEKKGNKDRKHKKAYIAWEDNASTTSDSFTDEEAANVCLMAKSMDESSTIEETKVNSEFEEVLEAFNEMHGEAQRLAILNKKLKSDLELHITKLAFSTK